MWTVSKPVPGYPGYFASDLGHVFSIRGNGHGVLHRKNLRALKPKRGGTHNADGGKHQHIGCFTDEIAAAFAFDNAARQHPDAEFISLNFESLNSTLDAITEAV